MAHPDMNAWIAAAETRSDIQAKENQQWGDQARQPRPSGQPQPGSVEHAAERAFASVGMASSKETLDPELEGLIKAGLVHVAELEMHTASKTRELQCMRNLQTVLTLVKEAPNAADAWNALLRAAASLPRP